MPSAFNDGIRIHYTVAGSGPSLMLHPGACGNLADWHHCGYVAALAEQYTLVLLDPRGHGRSDKPHDPSQYGPALWVGDVLAVLDAAEIDRVHFLGYSFGARVGFDLGVQAAQRFHSLILGGMHPFARDRAVYAERAALLRAQGMAPFVAAVVQQSGPPPPPMQADWLANDAEAIAAVFLALGDAPSLEADLPAARLPTLVYCGEHDSGYDKAQRAVSLMPNACFVDVAGLDHLQAYCQADRVLPFVTDFLQQVIKERTPA